MHGPFGVSFDPLSGRWSLGGDTRVNYLMTITRPAAPAIGTLLNIPTTRATTPSGISRWARVDGEPRRIMVGLQGDRNEDDECWGRGSYPLVPKQVHGCNALVMPLSLIEGNARLA